MIPLSFTVVGLTIARMFIDMALRSMYEKKHAKNIMTATISRFGITAGKLIGML